MNSDNIDKYIIDILDGLGVYYNCTAYPAYLATKSCFEVYSPNLENRIDIYIYFDVWHMHEWSSEDLIMGCNKPSIDTITEWCSKYISKRKL